MNPTRYSLTPLEIDWTLGTRRPTILLAQVWAKYDVARSANRGFRHVGNADYLTCLRGVFRQCATEKANVVIFPEYAWPYADRAQLLTDAKASLPPGGLCIAPFEHLNEKEYATILDEFPVPASIRTRELADVRGHARTVAEGSERINTCFALVRTGNEAIVAIPQRKTRAAALEDHGFVGGKCRYVVQGNDCAFATLICFDVLALDGAVEERPRDVLADTHLDFIFVPECNPSPFHVSYAQAIVDLFQNPTMSPLPPVLVFVNVAGNVALPGPGDVRSTGFSRIVGKLGTIEHPDHPSTFALSGVIAHPGSPRTLEDVRAAPDRLRVHGVEWLVARPQASLLSVSVPLDGPASDPAEGRLDTRVSVYRWVGAWQRVSAIGALTTPTARFGVPTELLVEGGLVGATETRKRLLAAIRHSSEPVWVRANPGAGKTALVASVLHELEAVGRRILWIDCESLEKTHDALAETILVRLGLVEGCRTPPADQWRAIETSLEKETTVVVLDSFERWGQSIPPELTDLHGWPVRVVVTSRRSETNRSPNPNATVFIPPLSRADARELLRRGKDVPERPTRLVAAANGLPLACVWLRRVAKRKSKQRRGAARIERIFHSCCDGLGTADLDVLRVVCSLQGPVLGKDVAQILRRTSIASSVRTLRDRILLSAAGGDPERIHHAHPLVRQLVRKDAAQWSSRIDAAITGWAKRRLREDAGDLNWDGFVRLEPDWDNIRSIIDQQLNGKPSQVDAGLEMWRAADHFLWSRGKFRERERLGRLAESVARSSHQRGYRIYALVDAIAETLWHLDVRTNAAECAQLLDEAERMCREDNSLVAERLHVAYYRVRFLRLRKNLTDALKLATRTVAQSSAKEHRHVHAQCLNQVGNIERAQRNFAEAHRAYDDAQALFEEMGDKEMVAVVHRQRGRCLLEDGRNREAIVEIELAMSAFESLALWVERAEAGIHHARALADAGDLEDAREEFSDLERYFSVIGLGTRLDELRQARDEALESTG